MAEFPKPHPPLFERRRVPFDQRDVINWTGGVVAMGLVLILAFVTFALVYVEVPEANQNALTLLIGILSANVGLVVGFYFGNSSQAKKQAETIDTQAKTMAAQATAAAIATPGNDTLVIPPGGTATASSTPAGTVVTTDDSKDTAP